MINDMISMIIFAVGSFIGSWIGSYFYELRKKKKTQVSEQKRWELKNKKEES